MKVDIEPSSLLLPPWARAYGNERPEDTYTCEDTEVSQLLEDMVRIDVYTRNIPGSEHVVPREVYLRHPEIPRGATIQRNRRSLVQISYPQTGDYMYGTGELNFWRDGRTEVEYHFKRDFVRYFAGFDLGVYRLDIDWVTDEQELRAILAMGPLTNADRRQITSRYFFSLATKEAVKFTRTPLGKTTGPLKSRDFRLVGLALEQLKAGL